MAAGGEQGGSWGKGGGAGPKKTESGLEEAAGRAEERDEERG